MNLINVRNKNGDLITVDLRTRQIRYLEEKDKQIEFIDLSSSDVSGYEYLFEHDKNLFLNSLVEDVETFLGIRLYKKNLKIVNTSG